MLQGTCRRAVGGQARGLFGAFKEGETARTQQNINQVREELPYDYKWLADAMWKDGRRATLSEIMNADPYNKELLLDQKIGERKHPLHYGIKAAFLSRQAVLQKKMQSHMVDESRYALPEGLTPLQRRVFIEMKKQSDKESEEQGLRIKRINSGAGHDPEYDQYLRVMNQMTPEDTRRLYVLSSNTPPHSNREGETEDMDVSDILRKGVMYTSVIVMMYLVYDGLMEFVQSQASSSRILF